VGRVKAEGGGGWSVAGAAEMSGEAASRRTSVASAR